MVPNEGSREFSRLFEFHLARIFGIIISQVRTELEKNLQLAIEK